MKVIASDFDNTLYVKDEKNMKENIEAVERFINRGNIFIIITGRSYTNIKKVLTEKKIPYSYLVCQDGANIFDQNDKCIKSNYLDKNKSLKIEEYLKNNNIEYSFESAFNDYDTIDNAVKITITLHEKDNAKKIMEDIKQIEDVYMYISSKHINIIDNYVNKSSALYYLEEKKYLTDEIIVIGDDINDFEMLSNYNGVVMKKHDPILDKLNKESINSVHEFIEKN